MLSRRRFLVWFSFAAAGRTQLVFAQQARREVARIGLLEPASAATFGHWRQALVSGLRELGWSEGRNFTIEARWAEGKYQRLPQLAGELVQAKVDVIVAASGPGIRAAQKATAAIPVVMVRTADPVSAGFVASLARPGRNITGLSNVHVDASSKYVELLRTVLPKLSRVGVLTNPGHPNHPAFLRAAEAAAKAHGITVAPAQADTAGAFEAAFAAMVKDGAQALITLPDPFFFAHARRIAELATQHGLPSMFWAREAVEAGGLMAYGQDNAEHYYRAAAYIDKILKGTPPAELPVEQPTKFEMVVNVATAKALRLRVPDELLLRADEVIR
jgi:putative ABC transport system substrate-binding protein